METKKSVMPENNYGTLLKEYEEFAYVISHDLSGPLRQIVGFTDILLKELGDDLPDKQKLYRDMIDHAVREAQLSLDALLEFSRLNTDEKHFEEFDTIELFADILRKLKPVIADKDADIKSKGLPSTLRGDKKILTQAFYHLLHNALKFQPKGQKPVIEISAEKQGPLATFKIKDNGIGIRPERHEQVFIILRKAVSNEEYAGRGVGLTFAKKIAMIHGGDVWLDSETGQGTTVFFQIDIDTAPYKADRDSMKMPSS